MLATGNCHYPNEWHWISSSLGELRGAFWGLWAALRVVTEVYLLCALHTDEAGSHGWGSDEAALFRCLNRRDAFWDTKPSGTPKISLVHIAIVNH